MAKKRTKATSEDAWGHAKKVCRLSVRHVEMARVLGMNPHKLPGLRPTSGQQWKVPVREFIEQCYRKRFGDAAYGEWPDERPVPTPSPARDPIRQAADLRCWLMNAAHDIECALAKGEVDVVYLADLGRELGEVAEALRNGRTIEPVPTFSPPIVAMRGGPPPDDEFDQTTTSRFDRQLRSADGVSGSVRQR